MSYLLNVMQQVFDKIKEKKDGASLVGGDMDGDALVYSDFDLGISFQPYQQLHELSEKGQVWVIGLASDDTPSLSRSSISTRDLPVQVGIQRKVVRNDALLTIGGEVLTLEDQIRHICRKELVSITVDGVAHQWQRTEALRDESGTPYAYNVLREASCFETFFTAFYRRVLS